MDRKKTSVAAVLMMVMGLIGTAAYAAFGYVFLFVNTLVKGLSGSTDLPLYLSLIGLIILTILSAAVFVLSIIVKVKLKNLENSCKKIRKAYLIILFVTSFFNLSLIFANLSNLFWAIFAVFGLIYLSAAIMVLSDLKKLKI